VGLGALAVATVGSWWVAVPAEAVVGGDTRVDVSSAEVAANGPSTLGDLSGDGRYVAFASDATNLVAGDTNGLTDVFLRDRVSGTTRLVSTAGAPANGASYGGSVSDDGRYVAFGSDATNLAGGAGGVFLRDLTTGAVTRVASGSGGGLSANGRYVAYTTSTGVTRRWDRTTATSVPVSDGDSAQISGSGRYVVTYGFDANDQPSYRYTDLVAGTTSDLWDKAESSPDYSWDDYPSLPALSTNGRFVAFSNDATGFAPSDTVESEEVYVVDTKGADTYLRATALYQEMVRGYDSPIAISGNGRVLAFHLSSFADGTETHRLVAFDRITGMTTTITSGDGFQHAAFDFTGSRVAYESLDGSIHTGAIAACSLDGTAGDDVLTGTSGADVICGRGGNDVIQGRGGNDVLAGGPGTDTVSFSQSDHDVVVRLHSWRAGGAGQDEVYGFENVDGSPFGDLLFGDDLANRLRGLGGPDTLTGFSGDDTLVGGAGADTCHGGADTDVATACESVTEVP